MYRKNLQTLNKELPKLKKQYALEQKLFKTNPEKYIDCRIIGTKMV